MDISFSNFKISSKEQQNNEQRKSHHLEIVHMSLNSMLVKFENSNPNVDVSFFITSWRE